MKRGRPEQQRSAKPAAQLNIAGWVNAITSAGSATILLAGLALGAVVERLIIDSLDRPAPPNPADGRLELRPGSQAPDPASEDEGAPAPAAQSLTREVEQLTLDQRGRQARRSYRAPRTGKPIVRVSRIDRERTSAIGTSVIPVPRDSSAMPDATLFVGKKKGQRWKIALAGTRSFQPLLDQIPEDLISAEEKELLTAFNNSAARSRQARTALSLPWRENEAWTLQAEAGRDGRRGATPGFVGFGRKNGQVLAAAGGRLYRLCSTDPGRGLIMVIHPNGLATQYYQMSEVTDLDDGSLVRRGDVLGRVGTDRPCGGTAADRPQVWFGVRDANGAVSLDGKEIGGWRFTASKRAPGLAMVRGSTRIEAGDAVENLGPVSVPSRSDSGESASAAQGRRGQAPGNGAQARTES